MIDKKIKEAFLAIDVPDRKAEILCALAEPARKREHRRIRPAAAILMSVLFLTMLMSAAAAGSMLLREGSLYYYRDSEGNMIKPEGFHMKDAADVVLSEKALDNIAPYVYAPRDPATEYETATCGEMEGFLDYSMRLPSFAENASRYVMTACGNSRETASVYVGIQPEGAGEDCSVRVYLRNVSINVRTASTPKLYDYALPDGTPVSIAFYKSMSGYDSVAAMYKDNGAVYHITLRGGNKNELLTQIKAILDTVE